MNEKPDMNLRNRNNSTIILLFGNNEYNQKQIDNIKHNQKQINSKQINLKSSKIIINKKTKKKITFKKIKIIALSELNILNRRYFLIYLFNSFVDKPI